ncbi:MAG TPA: 3-phosphoserine/phosphohydroxythreonine transaminase [Vicinamibacterales bacterium]|nr:3-phosphoserine/phosphohydroxythreonine transaminase [Vicinamibacterales bacterium]
MNTKERIFNFSAGPAVLPLAVLEEAQRDLMSLPGVGMSVLEISHRSKPFDEIIQGAEADIRALAGISGDYEVLFLQGGASLQFSMVPMNLLLPGTTADYVITGVWSQKALKEAKRVGTVHVAATTEADNFTHVPAQGDLKLTGDAAYVHVTSNNTIYGTQWRTLPDAGGRPLVNDASSDIFSQPIDVARHGLIYAGAQKNLAPAGLTLVIIRKDLLERTQASVPTMLSYKVHAENTSLFNTPPVFAIYVLRLVLKWLRANGGLEAMAEQNARKAGLLYAEIDRGGFYRGHARPDSRSWMNVTFRLPNEALEKQFVKESTAAGFDGLKGHRSVGGLRASIYNAFPEEGVAALVEFMREFERTNG